MVKIIAPSSNKGGVLKTSLSVNLAGVLSSFEKKVLLIDVDNQGNVATTFGIDPDNVEFTIYDLLINNPSLENPLDTIRKVSNNLDVIVANDDMAYFEIDILTDSTSYPNYFELLKNAIEPFKDNYDYIIVDTPPQMGLIAANVFNAVQDIIIPFQPEPYAFRSLVKTVNAISKFKKTNPELNISEIIPVRVRRTLMHRAFIDSAKAYAKTNEIDFSQYVIKESIKYSEMIALSNVPITLKKDIPNAIEQYKKVYENIAKEMGYIG